MAQAQPANHSQLQSAKTRTRAWGPMYKAVAYSPKLSRLQKAILNYLTMHLDPRKRATDSRWAKVSLIGRSIGYSNRHVQRGLKSLSEGHYVLIEHRFIHGRKAPSRFTLTNRIFDEYEQALKDKSARKALSRGCDIMSLSQCDIVADKSSETIEEVEIPNKFSTPAGEQNVHCLDKARKERKPSTREKARSILVSMIKITPRHFISHKAVDRTADRLLDQFGIGPFYELERRVARAGKMGSLPWDPNALEYELACIANGGGLISE